MQKIILTILMLFVFITDNNTAYAVYTPPSHNPADYSEECSTTKIYMHQDRYFKIPDCYLPNGNTVYFTNQVESEWDGLWGNVDFVGSGADVTLHALDYWKNFEDTVMLKWLQIDSDVGCGSEEYALQQQCPDEYTMDYGTCEGGCPPVECPEQGTVLPGQTTAPGNYPETYCLESCQLVEGESFLGINDRDANTTSMWNLVYTGENCTPNDAEATNNPDIPFPTIILPSYPLVQLGDPPVLYPDQDKDGIPAGNDPDVDGDGIPNQNDPDIDGDGTPNGSDNDVDGDATSNGGEPGGGTLKWVFSQPSPDDSGGLGADPDVDGDDLENGEDGDVDGDGWQNGEDGDVDGDGYGNSDDGDIDGDGTPNSSDTTPYGIGGGDGTTTGTTTGTGTEEDGDDTPPDNDNAEDLEGPGSGDAIESASCPDGEICIGDGICQEGETPTSADCASDTYFQDRFQTMTDNIKATGMFSLTDNIAGIPSGGSSVKSVDLGAWGGVQEFDFAEFNFAWAILNSVFTIGFMWIGIKIVTLKQT